MNPANVAKPSAPVGSRLALDLLSTAAEMEARAVLDPVPQTAREVADLRALAADLLKADREAAEARQFARPAVAPQRSLKVMAELSDEELAEARAALRGGRK